MAPKPKLSGEYYPHAAKLGSEVELIKFRYGVTGHSLNVSLLEKLTVSENHFIDLFKRDVIDIHAHYCMVTAEQLIDFMDYITETYPDFYDRELWSKYRIVRNNNLVDRLVETLYKDRSSLPMTVERIKEKFKIRTESEVTKKKEKKTKLKEKEVNERKENKREENRSEEKESKVKESDRLASSDYRRLSPDATRALEAIRNLDSDSNFWKWKIVKHGTYDEVYDYVQDNANDKNVFQAAFTLLQWERRDGINLRASIFGLLITGNTTFLNQQNTMETLKLITIDNLGEHILNFYQSKEKTV